MKSQATWWAGLTLLAAAFAGCGGPPETAENTDQEAESRSAHDGASTDAGAAAENKLPQADAPPEQVVAAFLQSLSGGDDDVAAALLTVDARRSTSSAHLKVEPPGSAEATYRVGQVSFVDDNRLAAHVSSVWSDNVEGERISYDVTWVLRKHPEGWRIMGMATRPAAAKPAIFLNFEDAADMMERVRQADAQLAEADPDAPRDPLR